MPSVSSPRTTLQNEGTCLGASWPSGRIIDIAPIDVPVFSSVPIDVLAWSAMNAPILVSPVSSDSPRTGTRTCE